MDVPRILAPISATNCIIICAYAAGVACIEKCRWQSISHFPLLHQSWKWYRPYLSVFWRLDIQRKYIWRGDSELSIISLIVAVVAYGRC